MKKEKNNLDSRSSEQGHYATTTDVKSTVIREALGFVKTMTLVAVFALLLNGTIVRAFKIPSGSMLPTLHIGDHIFVSKLHYGLRLAFVPTTLYQWGVPKRGDIVVFRRIDDPSTPVDDEADKHIIKRVVGLPGEKIEVRGAQVLIDGQALKEPYAVWSEGGLRDFPATRIPDGHIFMLGDNRDHSRDSRFWEDSPFLPIERVEGKALLIYWNIRRPTERIGKLIR